MWDKLNNPTVVILIVGIVGIFFWTYWRNIVAWLATAAGIVNGAESQPKKQEAEKDTGAVAKVVTETATLDPENFTELERKLGIVDAKGYDPEMIAFRSNRIMKKAQEVTDALKEKSGSKSTAKK